MEVPQSFAATEAALAVTELLEMILFELPTRDLLFAQKVCKQWKAKIEQSSKLQQALFFRSIVDQVLPSCLLFSDTVKYVTNPLLRSIVEALIECYCDREEKLRTGVVPYGWDAPEASWRRIFVHDLPWCANYK